MSDNLKIISEYVLPAGKVLVLKTTRAGGRSDHSPDFIYPGVGETVTAPAWDGKAECGPGGLHGWLWGCGSVQNAGAEWAFLDPAAEWRVLEVDGSECLDIDSGSKCKFRTGSVVLLATLQECALLLARYAPAGSAIIGGTATAGYNGTATAGYNGTATAGNGGTATAGVNGTATAGYNGTATAGYNGTATAGYNGTATAGNGGTATAGVNGTATAGYNGTATAGVNGTATAGVNGTATAGYNGTATAGVNGTATAGDHGTATAGDHGTATVGYNGTATAGDSGTATAGDHGTATAGYRGTATAGDHGTILLQKWDVVAKRYRTVVGNVGIDGIESEVPYVLDDHGKLVRK